MDLAYYALAALAVVILYVDNEHQRRDLRRVLAQDQLARFEIDAASLEAKLETLPNDLSAAAAERVKATEEASKHDALLALSKVAAADEFGRRQKANESYCADPETLRCSMQLRGLRSDVEKRSEGSIFARGGSTCV